MPNAARIKTGRSPLQQEPARSAPNWALLAVAAVGMALTAYLTAAALRGHAVAGCTAGSVCDVVLGSRWAKLFGLPTSMWGFLAYAALAAVAFVKRAWLHWRLAFIVSMFGVLYSAYLTGVSLFVLAAACPYCLTSFALMITAFALTVYQRPADLPRFSWTPWLAKTVPAALALIFVLHLSYAGTFDSPAASSNPKLAGLADHLSAMNVKFYGASWCPHCRDQKEMFGAAAERLPYVECSPQGRGGPEAPACAAMHIQGYPTWIINGQRYEGVLSLADLARLSGYVDK
jgi:uncharacterized membrane protein